MSDKKFTHLAEFDRFDICEAAAVLEWDYNVGGWLRERHSNQRRMEATSVQLHRIGFKPSPALGFDTLSDNAKTIYFANVLRWKLPFDDEQLAAMNETFAPEFMAQFKYEKKAFSGMYEAVP